MHSFVCVFKLSLRCISYPTLWAINSSSETYRKYTIGAEALNGNLRKFTKDSGRGLHDGKQPQLASKDFGPFPFDHVVQHTSEFLSNIMSVLCYNKGCGQRFDPDKNSDGKTLNNKR